MAASLAAPPTWCRDLFGACASGLPGTSLICWPMLPIDMNAAAGPASDEIAAMLFDSVPVLDGSGTYLGSGSRADDVYRDIVPPASWHAAAGARPGPDVDMAAWSAAENRRRSAVEVARRASLLTLGEEWLAVRAAPAQLTHLTGDIIEVPTTTASGDAIIRAQVSTATAERDWLDRGFLAASDWYWPGHRRFSLADGEGHGQLGTIINAAVLVWSAVLISPAAVVTLLSPPPWRVLGYGMALTPAAPSLDDPNLHVG